MKRLIAGRIEESVGRAAERKLLFEQILAPLLGWTLGHTEWAKWTSVLRSADGAYGVVLYKTRDADPENTILWVPPGRLIFDHTKIPAGTVVRTTKDEVTFIANGRVILEVPTRAAPWGAVPSMMADDDTVLKLWYGLSDDKLWDNRFFQAISHRKYDFWIEQNGQSYAVPHLPLSDSPPRVFSAVTHLDEPVPNGTALRQRFIPGLER